MSAFLKARIEWLTERDYKLTKELEAEKLKVATLRALLEETDKLLFFYKSTHPKFQKENDV